MAIDTLKVARRLREAGFNEAQSEALVAAVQAGADGGDFATKADLAILAAELRAEIAALRSELRGDIGRVGNEVAALRAEIATVKADLLGRMFQMILGAVLINIVAMAGLMFGFAKLLGH